MIYCFDTSVINQLYDDVDRDIIVRGLLSTNTIYITGVNIVEGLATSAHARRRELLGFQKLLARGLPPLALPVHLLKTLTYAYAEARFRPDYRRLTYDLLYDELLQIDETKRQELLLWKDNIESSFGTFRRVRNSYEQLFTSGGAARPNSLADLIRFHFRDEEFLYSIMSELYLITGRTLPRERLFDFLRFVPEWPLVLLGMAYATYERSMKLNGYGPRGKAGALDLWSAAYLPYSDYFVTNDKDQTRAFRTLNVLNPRHTRVLYYPSFKARLIVG